MNRRIVLKLSNGINRAFHSGGHGRSPAVDASVRCTHVVAGQGFGNTRGLQGLHRLILGPGTHAIRLPLPPLWSLYVDVANVVFLQPLRYDMNRKLFEAEEQDLFADLQSLPRNAALRKLNDLIKRARLAKVSPHSTTTKQIPRPNSETKAIKDF